jgi:hypothetical protein
MSPFLFINRLLKGSPRGFANVRWWQLAKRVKVIKRGPPVWCLPLVSH